MERSAQNGEIWDKKLRREAPTDPQDDRPEAALMGTRANPGRYDCLAKAMHDEPYFVLIGRDDDAHDALLTWICKRLEAVLRDERSRDDLPQVREAFDCLIAMIAWRNAHSRAGRPPSLDLGPADQAWIRQTLNILIGKTRLYESQADRNADDQGIRRPT